MSCMYIYPGGGGSPAASNRVGISRRVWRPKNGQYGIDVERNVKSKHGGRRIE